MLGKTNINFGFCLALLGSSFAFSQDQLSPTKLEAELKDIADVPSTTLVDGSAGAETSYFPSPIPGNSKLSHSVLGLVHFGVQNQSEMFDNKVDVTFGKYIDWGSSFFSPKELYTSYKSASTNTRISIGRKTEFWSEADKNWQLGVWQPQYKFEPLRPFEQGLFGLIINQKMGNFELLAFATPMTIPTTGPDIKEQDGNLVSDSRWYQQPSSSGVILGGGNTKMVYSLAMPPITELVGHPGRGVRLGWNVSEKTGLWASANYGEKPMNTLLMKYDANLMINKTSQILVSPVVGQHQLFGADIGYKFENAHMSLSYLEENPVQALPVNSNSSDWWQQVPGASKSYAAHLESEVKTIVLLDPVSFGLDYIKVDEKRTNDVDSSGLVRSAILPNRSLFTNALSVDTKISTSVRGKKLITNFRVLRDFDQQGNIYHTQFDLMYAKQWDISVGMEALVPDDSSEQNSDARFINQFRANDRIYGGVNYVF